MSEYRGVDLIQEPDRVSWNKRTGFTIGRPFRGSQAKIEQAKIVALEAGDAFELNPGSDGSEWEIIIYYGAEETQSTNDPLSDNWEFDINGLEKELWDLPFVRDGFQTLMNDADNQADGVLVINWVRSTLEKFFQGESKGIDLAGQEYKLTFQNIVEKIASQGAITPGGVSDLDPKDVSSWVYRISKLYSRGVKKFPISQLVLRRTRVLASNFDFENIAHSGDDVFKRRTTESLQSHEPIPEKYKKLMLPGEWVKHSAKVRQQSSTKDELIEEWWHADVWEEEIYGALI